MKIFAFDRDEMRATWAAQGWIHARPGVTDEFLDHLESVVAEAFADRPLSGPGLAGAKDQFLFEPPEGLDLGAELLDVVCEVTGLDRSTVTLSERHIKAYFGDADPRPSAHKDRVASTVALGISVRVPEASHVVLYPDHERDENPLLGPGLNAYLDPERHPDAALHSAREVTIDDEPGDVLAFAGASTWHLRRNSAETVLLYLKFNDFGADPLGEDPRTELRRQATLGLVDASGNDLDGAVPVFSRRFEHVAQAFERRALRGDGMPPRWMATVWDRPPVPLDDADVELLRAVDGRATVADLAARFGAERLARLARREVLDLLS